MARYKVVHDLHRTWICKNKDETYYWGPYENSFKFQNYFKAKAAVDSLPDEKRMYGESYKKRIHYMKVGEKQ